MLYHVLMPEGLAETCLEPKEYPRAFPVYLWNAELRNTSIKIQNVFPFSYTLLGTLKTHVRTVFKQVAAKHYHDDGPQTPAVPRLVQRGKESHNLTRYPKPLCPSQSAFQPILSTRAHPCKGERQDLVVAQSHQKIIVKQFL